MKPKPDLKRALQRSGLDVLGTGGRSRVLVELVEATDAALQRLTELGMEVERLVGNTVLGSVESSRITALRQTPGVLAVDLSVPLAPKRD